MVHDGVNNGRSWILKAHKLSEEYEELSNYIETHYIASSANMAMEEIVKSGIIGEGILIILYCSNVFLWNAYSPSQVIDSWNNYLCFAETYEKVEGLIEWYGSYFRW